MRKARKHTPPNCSSDSKEPGKDGDRSSSLLNPCESSMTFIDELISQVNLDSLKHIDPSPQKEKNISQQDRREGEESKLQLHAECGTEARITDQS